MARKKTSPTKSKKFKTASKALTINENDLNRLEFHRNAVGMIPEAGDKDPGVATMVFKGDGEDYSRFCTCRACSRKTCNHLKKLAAAYRVFTEAPDAEDPVKGFPESMWHALARFFGEDSGEASRTVTAQISSKPENQHFKIVSPDGHEIFTYLSGNSDGSRFLERCCNPDQSKKPKSHTRSHLLNILELRTLTETEREMANSGYKTRGMAFRETFWYRMAYHGYREFGPNGCTLRPSIDESDGRFVVSGINAEETPIFRLTVPRLKVEAFLKRFQPWMSNHNGFSVSPVPLDLIFDASMRKDMGIDVQPALRMIQENGSFKLLDGIDFEHFQYGDLVYIRELNLLANMQQAEVKGPGLKEKAKTIIEKSQVPAFLDAHREDLRSGTLHSDEQIRNLRVFNQADRIRVHPSAMDRDWCWLSVEYGFGNEKISLSELLEAREKGQRYIPTSDGWIDSHSPSLDPFLENLNDAEEWNTDGPKGHLPFTRQQLLRISALSDVPLAVSGNTQRAGQLKRLISGKASMPLPDLSGKMTALRKYQEQGVQWLWYLVENGFGGLLCDDMGLGKTHQVMALMTAICCSESGKPEENHKFLVVCPTTVMGHWEEKIEKHAPSLKAGLYHGTDRNLEEAIEENGVLITSYGVLLRDIGKLNAIPFTLAVFDEIQYIKNPETQSHRAAKKIHTGGKLGLTGTPVENSVTDIKALLDLTVPGYLGSNGQFKTKFADEIEADPQSLCRDELRRLISPFTLRRLKSTVLTELPEKIEDFRTCRLSEDQVKLYRDAIEQRKAGLLEKLRSPNAAVPYLHIFALLTLLKQICDHPAIVENDVEHADRYASGKWELFTEIISECLDSGQKVVVYSQFLGMIDIIDRYLTGSGIGHAVLTGKSRNRKEIIRRFNEDPECRVFVGSLKAGGTGIDLVAASVVIHYDRWWNSAKEDQATDRVHRIGQKRGVQVFKLVTRGTLEEKISAIIARKKNLMESVVPEDDPGVLKIFTKEDFISLMDTTGIIR